MMPVYVCRDCKREFAGWGARHKMATGKGLFCPECEGALEERREGEGKNTRKGSRKKAA